jgi:hypothetical protein
VAFSHKLEAAVFIETLLHFSYTARRQFAEESKQSLSVTRVENI